MLMVWLILTLMDKMNDATNLTHRMTYIEHGPDPYGPDFPDIVDTENSLLQCPEWVAATVMEIYDECGVWYRIVPEDEVEEMKRKYWKEG